MAKQITMRDVAKAAGVSVATVSYVINGREEQCISEATRKKVLQVVNLLHYQPNAASPLEAEEGKFVQVALRPCLPRGLLLDAEFARFFCALSRKGFEEGFLFHLSLGEQGKRVDGADVILSLNLSEESFRALANANLVPLVGAFTYLDDFDIFYSVRFDFCKAKERADAHFSSPYRLICFPINDAHVRKEALEAFPEAIFATGLEEIEALPSGNYYCLQGAFAECLKGKPGNRVLFEEEGLETFVDAILEALRRSIASSHPDPHHLILL